MTRAEVGLAVLELARKVGAGALEQPNEDERRVMEEATSVLVRLGWWLERRDLAEACPHCHGVGLVIRTGRTTRCVCQGVGT